MTESYLYNGQSPDEHVASCPDCGAAIALLDEPDPAVAPPPTLREAVLSMARRRRSPAVLGVSTVAVPYAEQVALMDDLLAELSEPQWEAPIAKHGTVGGLVEHLADNDATVARFLGARFTGVPRPAVTPAHRRWREQAGSLLARVSASSEVLLGVEVALAGARPARAPLRQAMVQRTFETWTHAEDIRAATDRAGSAPRAEHVHMIAEFGLALLPRAEGAAPRRLRHRGADRARRRQLDRPAVTGLRPRRRDHLGRRGGFLPVAGQPVGARLLPVRRGRRPRPRP
ncbi:maleylpyruvate isomerase N-terminal domain-containing protein [Nonomuraea jiangxiensis]|uniref:Mycothiol maleylpyruvate isomerase N-terminal domain-containing protein n=1 Tax=Nonomuraea jiangxiensis TaxID=633440 RepID=A0A1G8RKS5_9ACTN|nr:maleylpyruvate isomerase N-terminal domain-containing protein [Nonomuraea jiangxiensis]SDJ17556.1 Mycothiol maleylpyruvate isomerase N-terminal domain-containing protein [Nonomuraea jiangxiensis]